MSTDWFRNFMGGSQVPGRNSGVEVVGGRMVQQFYTPLSRITVAGWLVDWFVRRKVHKLKVSSSYEARGREEKTGVPEENLRRLVLQTGVNYVQRTSRDEI